MNVYIIQYLLYIDAPKLIMQNEKIKYSGRILDTTI